MSGLSYSQETNSQSHNLSFNSITSEDDQSNQSSDNSRKKKKTLGRVKIDTAYIDDKIRRCTTFSKRKTGIMKKAYELATLTGTEVMLLVASETGHVYTYATPKLQPMITSETGKALIQTCLAKDESIIEPAPVTTTLNDNDVILTDGKKRTNSSKNGNLFSPNKRAKLQLSDEIKQVNTTTTVALPLTYLINPKSQQQTLTDSRSFTIDFNSLQTNRVTSILTPPPSDIPLVLTLGNSPYQPP